MSGDPWFVGGEEATRRVTLPSRAFFSSWRDQTLPARRAALAESRAYFEEVADDPDTTGRDLALAALIADAIQPHEDLAHLGRAWDEPFGGLAIYVRATTYSGRTATNFWNGIVRRDDTELKIFAGIWGRDPQTQAPVSMIPAEMESELGASGREAVAAAEAATVTALRRQLSVLGGDWLQFSPYYNAFKHGGLVVNRTDIRAVADEVEAVDEETPLHDPSIAVWVMRGGETSGLADFNLTREQLARTVTSSGQLALRMLERFIESRSAIFEALDLAPDGSVAELGELTLPFTVWLNEAELSEEHWRLLGRGPRIAFTDEPEEES